MKNNNAMQVLLKIGEVHDILDLHRVNTSVIPQWKHQTWLLILFVLPCLKNQLLGPPQPCSAHQLCLHHGALTSWPETALPWLPRWRPAWAAASCAHSGSGLDPTSRIEWCISGWTVEGEDPAFEKPSSRSNGAKLFGKAGVFEKIFTNEKPKMGGRMSARCMTPLPPPAGLIRCSFLLQSTQRRPVWGEDTLRGAGDPPSHCGIMANPLSMYRLAFFLLSLFPFSLTS